MNNNLPDKVYLQSDYSWNTKNTDNKHIEYYKANHYATNILYAFIGGFIISWLLIPFFK